MKLFGQKITFGITHRVELILLVLYGMLFLAWDFLQNQLLKFGLEHETFGIQTLDLAVIFLIAFHLVLVSLIFISVNSKNTTKVLDYVVGAFTAFGVAIILVGFILALYAENINFLFIQMPILDFYHIGVGLEMFGGIYYAVTK